VIGAAAFFVGLLALAAGFSRIALRLVCRVGLIDHPNERSSHAEPVPRGGGIGIVATVLLGVPSAALLLPSGPDGRTMVVVLLALAAIAMAGFLDDRQGLKPGAKSLVQATAAVGTIWTLGSVETVGLPFLGPVSLGVAALPLTVVWLLGYSNAFNFMDGIDGIAALHGALAAVCFSAASLIGGGGGLRWLALPVAAGCLGFLTVNWQPARVFMGDVGSLPLGFALALLALVGRAEGTIPFPASFLILGPFLFDTIYTVARRALRRENLLAAHRSHLYQRLVITGLSHRWVALLYGGWTVFLGTLGMGYLFEGSAFRITTLGLALASGFGIVVLVRHREGRSP
jgi:UDP-N-acetylmuramyl pentapeptide phosphotransferase/UDP-N-acetylglucosamine-1-phosphate transferase